MADQYPRVSCTEAHPHPQGARISQQFGVAYIEIMDWLCQGHGFGPIRQAYRASQEIGVAVEAIFSRVEAGEEWADILADLGATAIDMEAEDDGD